MAESYSVEAYLKAVGVDEFAKSFEKARISIGDTDKTTQKADTSIKGILKTIAGVAAAVGVFNTLRKAVDGAVSRYDTLNNFPKVLEMMGFSAGESQKAIERLSDGIQGLPTTLDDVAGTAQRIATMTGDLDGAVETTLALNNAFISSGTDSANAARGLDQYVQMLSKGEVDLQSWRSLQETMGVALNDTAKAFGFAGKSAQNDLYDALKEGDITFDQFNDKLIELSKETGGFADRALTASGGIRTAFANMNTSVVRGVTNIIGAIDDALSKTRLKSIQNIIESIGKSSFATLDAISKAVGPAIDALAFLYNVIQPLLPLIVGLAAGFGTFYAATSVASVLSLAAGFTVLKSAMETVAIASMLMWDAMKANPVIAIISVIAGLAAMIAYLWKTNETFRNIVTSAWQSVQDAVDATVQSFQNATSAVGKFAKRMAPAVVDGFNKAIEKTAYFVSSLGGHFSAAGEHISTFIGSLGTGIVNGFNASIEWLSDATQTASEYLARLKESIDLKGVLSKVLGPLVTVATVFFGLASPIGWLIKALGLMATQTTVFSDALAVLTGDMSIGQFVNNFASELANLITNMAESAAEMITKGSEMISGFIEGMAEKLPEIIQIGTEAITKFVEGLAASIGEIAPIAIQAITTFVDNITANIPKIVATGVEIITTLINSITTALPLVLGVGIEIITTLVETIATMIPMLFETGVMILITLIDAIVMNLPLLVEIYIQIVTTFIETIITMIPLIIEVVIQLIMTIIDTIITMLPILIEIYVQIFMTLIETVITILPLIAETILTLIMTIINTLIENLPLIIDAGIQILMALIDGIITILPVLIESIIMIIQSILGVVIENLPLIIDAGIQILMALIDGIISVVPALLSAGVNLIISLVKAIIGLLPQLLNAGVQILLALIKGIISVVPQLLSAGIQLITQLVSAIIGMLPQFLSAGKDLITSLKDGALSLAGSLLSAGKELVTSMISGITGMFGNVLSTGKDLAKNALDGVTGKIGDFMDAGKNIVGSIADGIKGAAGKVTGAISSVTQKIRDFLPFSPAKEGALRDIMKIQIPQSIAESIDKGRSVAERAMVKLSDAIYGQMPALETMDIAGKINGIHARSQRQFSYDYQNEVSVNKQPANINIQIGRSEFTRFVEDITDEQDLLGGRDDEFLSEF